MSDTKSNTKDVFHQFKAQVDYANKQINSGEDFENISLFHTPLTTYLNAAKYAPNNEKINRVKLYNLIAIYWGFKDWDDLKNTLKSNLQYIESLYLNLQHFIKTVKGYSLDFFDTYMAQQEFERIKVQELFLRGLDFSIYAKNLYEDMPFYSDFRWVSFYNCDFSYCRFIHVSFYKAKFVNTKFDYTDFNGWVENYEAQGMPCFEHAIIDHCSFVGAKIKNSYMRNAYIKDTSFENANLCDLVTAFSCSFNDCDFRGANLSGARHINLNYVTMNQKTILPDGKKYQEKKQLDIRGS